MSFPAEGVAVTAIRYGLSSLNALFLILAWGHLGAQTTSAPAASKLGAEEGAPVATRVFAGMEFVWIPPGEFVMGSPGNEDWRDSWEGPQHSVNISRGFWMGKYEVTQGQWEEFMGSNPSRFKKCGATCPVERVSWNDVRAFIQEVNRREGSFLFRLPTEAEWEYAARAGAEGPRYAEVDLAAWYDKNSGKRTQPVGQKTPNRWGLHDILGNVWEWTADWYGPYPAGPVIDQKGPGQGQHRVFRGGSWRYTDWRSRAAIRRADQPNRRRDDLGFRLVRVRSFADGPPPSFR